MFMLFQQKCCKQKLPQCNTMSTLKHFHPTCPKERAAWNIKQLFLEILRKRFQYETCSVPQRKHRISGQTADQQTVENTKSNTRVLNPTVQSCHIADAPLVRERKQGHKAKPKVTSFPHWSHLFLQRHAGNNLIVATCSQKSNGLTSYGCVRILIRRRIKSQKFSGLTSLDSLRRWLLGRGLGFCSLLCLLLANVVLLESKTGILQEVMRSLHFVLDVSSLLKRRRVPVLFLIVSGTQKRSGT